MFGYYGKKFSYYLTQALTWTGIQTFDSLVATTADINGGTIDSATIGGTTPAAVYASPTISKGPAAITSFAGTVSTSGSSTTVTWSSAADAILAGYNATNPTLGTTIITGAIKQASVTRYVVSWTNATACVVDSACTLAAATELTSVQLPESVFVTSTNGLSAYVDAAGKTTFFSRAVFLGDFIILGAGGLSNYIDTTANNPVFRGYSSITVGTGAGSIKLTPTGGNILLGGLAAAGTTADKVLAMGSGTAPTDSPLNAAQMWVEDKSGVAGYAGFHMRDEIGNTGPIAFAQLKVITHSATENALASNMYGHARLVTGAYTISLPTATVGYHTTFMATTAAVFSVDVITGTDAFYLNGVLLTAGNKITSDGSIRAEVFIKCVVAGIYEATATQGIFIDGG